VVYMAVESPDRGSDESWKSKQRNLAVAKAQAEISFKAGIREVVENISKILIDVVVDKRVDKLEKLLYHWQAKLKERRIEQPSQPKEVKCE